MMRYTPLIIFMLIALALGAGLMIPEAVRKAHPTTGLMDKPLPRLNLVPFAHDRTWDANALKGKVTVVNVFATWCAPCEVELPELQALRGIDSRVQVLGIAWRDTEERLTTWAKRMQVPYDAIWLDSTHAAGIALGIRGVPESFIVDTNGVVRYHLPGPIVSTTRTQTITPLIEELLHE
jgi:cytochrome c biogenesis protein CcmG/thiol:disulfide interchange protein DsbE